MVPKCVDFSETHNKNWHQHLTVNAIAVQLYSFEGEIVLDPFIGSGQSAIASIKTKRHYVGYDINKDYLKLAEKRIKEFSNFNTQNLFEFEGKKEK